MNLVEGYHERRLTVVTIDQYGATKEKEILIGNCKGILVVKAGTQEHPCSQEEMYNIHQAVSKTFSDVNGGENVMCTIPHYVSIEYIKM